MSHDLEMLKSFPTPISANDDIPKWWLDGESFLNKNDYSAIVKNKEDRIAGMKGCMPFLDAVSSGYLIRLWRSVEISWENDSLVIKQVVKDKNGIWVEDDFEDPYKCIGVRNGDLGHTMPRPAGYHFSHLAWACPWGMRTPKNWSVIITHPMNRYELPFITLSGIVETDKFSANGNLPFFIKNGWSGVIEAGTPIAQVIPVKRSSWLSTNRFGLSKKTTYFANAARSVNYGYYRSKMWIKKKYLTNENNKS